MAVNGLNAVTRFLFYLLVVVNAHYADDSDYKDLEFYEEVPIGYIGSFEKDRLNVVEEDFYADGDFEEAAARGRRCDVCPDMRDLGMPFKMVEDSVAVPPRDARVDWYKPQRVYRYTKHRIPGYDYVELDHVITKKIQQCDEKSLWTHCLCQFTCSEPDTVDCYTPCKSGCECKEEFVFDEKTQQCLLPEHCSTKEEDFTY